MHPEHLIELIDKTNNLPKSQIPQPTKLQFCFPANTDAVRKVLADTLTGLRHLELPIEETGTIEIVLAEALNNVVEHSYADRPSGMVNLQIDQTSNDLCFLISDRGQPMPDNALPLGRPHDLNCAMHDLPEGGFGWFLIRDLARDLQYTRKGRKNILSFRIAVNQPELQLN
jgi:serine/threonine-protein kinase RsbW